MYVSLSYFPHCITPSSPQVPFSGNALIPLTLKLPSPPPVHTSHTLTPAPQVPFSGNALIPPMLKQELAGVCRACMAGDPPQQVWKWVNMHTVLTTGNVGSHAAISLTSANHYHLPHRLCSSSSRAVLMPASVPPSTTLTLPLPCSHFQCFFSSAAAATAAGQCSCRCCCRWGWSDLVGQHRPQRPHRATRGARTGWRGGGTVHTV